MNVKRLIIAILVGFVVFWATDFVVHEVLLKADYQAAQSLWRPESEMGSYIGWLFAAELLFTITFVLLWTRWAEGAQLGCAIGFGFLMGLASGVWPIILYVVMPLPGSIACKWFFAGIVQAIILGIVTFYVYKPKPVAA